VTHVVLIGMMGSGKTTIGELVAARLGMPFVDSDREIERRTGATVAELFASGGEPAFRTLESEVLLEALDRHDPSVIAAAGGAVLDPRNRQAMRDRALVVWLRADPSVLAERVKGGTHRPLLADDATGTLQALATQREQLYRETAHRHLDVDTLTVEEATDQVVAALTEVRA
jgi:shikimate kinase